MRGKGGDGEKQGREERERDGGERDVEAEGEEQWLEGLPWFD